MSTTRERLERIVLETLNDPSVKFSDELSMASCEAWDSVATVQIVLEVEQEFVVRFTTDEVAGVRGVADLLHLLERYGALSK
jgi:acyl carrier protein